ncbi:MAG: glycosyltransferase family 1 protein [Thermoguttaceae bacterium]
MPRRIAMISEHASPLGALGGVDGGGQNVYVAQVARHLTQAGHEVDVFTRRDNAGAPTIVQPADRLRVIHVDAGPPRFVPKEELLPWMDEFSEFMRRFIRDEGQYDLIHANFFMSGLVACQLKAATGTPFAVTFHALGRVRLLHQGETDRFPPARLAIETRTMREADAIIAECPQDQADQCHLYGADARRIHVVPCGFDGEELSPVNRIAARRRLGLDPDQRWIVHIGRLVPRKGVDTAIEGLARLVRRHRIEAQLLVIGGESEEPDPLRTLEIGRLMDVAGRAGVADRVTFTGRRGRGLLRYYYSAADVFVTTPWYEPFGITPVEAMACGTPVIGAEVGGIQYTVLDGRTGYLVPPKDPDALAERLAALFRRPRLMRRMGRAGIARVNRLFTWRGVANRLASVYEAVLDGRRVHSVQAATVCETAPAETNR